MYKPQSNIGESNMVKCKECCGRIGHAPYCPQPHQWAHVIEAIAQGKPIQVSVDLVDRWQDVNDIRVWNPIRYPEYQWRVKPEIVTYKAYINLYSHGFMQAGFMQATFKTRELAEAFGKSKCSYIKTIEVCETIEV
jgi:hypothetical protein